MPPSFATPLVVSATALFPISNRKSPQPRSKHTIIRLLERQDPTRWAQRPRIPDLDLRVRRQVARQLYVDLKQSPKSRHYARIENLLRIHRDAVNQHTETAHRGDTSRSLRNLIWNRRRIRWPQSRSKQHHSFSASSGRGRGDCRALQMNAQHRCSVRLKETRRGSLQHNRNRRPRQTIDDKLQHRRTRNQRRGYQQIHLRRQNEINIGGNFINTPPPPP